MAVGINRTACLVSHLVNSAGQQSGQWSVYSNHGLLIAVRAEGREGRDGGGGAGGEN